MVGEERTGISRHGPALGSGASSWGGIVIRHAEYAGGGDTTLGLYKLQFVAFEEGLFILESRFAAEREQKIKYY